MALGDQLVALAAEESLPQTYPAMAERWFSPLADWLQARQAEQCGPLLVGVNGAQGTGKTTACSVLALMLAERGLSGAVLSLDDFYLDKPSRVLLGKVAHPLLETRGVPGTHEVELLEEVVDSLLMGGDVSTPVFDKAADDRLPRDQWRSVPSADVTLLEGWCIGAIAEPDSALQTPINSLEQEADGDGYWRGFVNAQLEGPYAELFAKLHALVMLRAPSMEQVLEWRRLQESKLAARRSGSGVMTPEQVARFVQHYERVTRHTLAEMPQRADYVLDIDAEHDIVGARHR